MQQILTSFISSFFITYFAIPSIIKVANIRKIFDEPDERKLHTATIPALGGVAIFSGVLFSILFWSEDIAFEQLRWIILSLLIIFLLGLKDDIVSIDPLKKLVGEIIAACIIIYYGDIRIYELHGFLSVHELSYPVSVLLTLFTIIVITNALNLIDGIDGLAGGIGFIASFTFGITFIYCQNLLLASISFAMAGSLAAFLRYNFSPAKIFMGDSGSLVIGFILSVLCIHFMNTKIIFNLPEESILPTPPLALAILIIPLTDTLRVFIIRILHKQSPFKADRNHLHHMLLKVGLNHKSISLTLYTVNILFISMSILFHKIGLNFLFFLVTITAFILSHLSHTLLQRKEQAKQNSIYLRWKNYQEYK